MALRDRPPAPGGGSESPFDIRVSYVPRTEHEQYKASLEEQLREARVQAHKGLNDRRYLERQHSLERAKWQKEVEDAHAQKERLAAARWSREKNAKICKPIPARREWIDMVSPWSHGQNAIQLGDGSTTPIRPALEPPLYDNIPDKLRQMTVDVWLLRSKIAYAMEEWQAMEIYSRKAHDLAKDLDWGPFVAMCAFPQGVAFYKQGYWQQAHAYLQEAEKTKGYYIPQKEVSRWLKLASEKLHDPAPPFRERAPVVSPLTALPENEGSVKLRFSAITSASVRPSPQTRLSSQRSSRTKQAEDSAVSVQDFIPRTSSESASQSHGQVPQGISDPPLRQDLPPISPCEIDLPPPMLSSDPRPPGLTTTSRLYIPGPHSSPKRVPLPESSGGGKSLQLRTALIGSWDSMPKLPVLHRPVFESPFGRKPRSAHATDVRPSLSLSETPSPSSRPPDPQTSPRLPTKARAASISPQTPSQQQRRRSLQARQRSEGA
ncbi:MAG: hypothetical protein Q9220_002782 [cf. Caloplaca sp. 1 TL-2023]